MNAGLRDLSNPGFCTRIQQLLDKTRLANLQNPAIRVGQNLSLRHLKAKKTFVNAASLDARENLMRGAFFWSVAERCPRPADEWASTSVRHELTILT
jgi:hypothetical protein